MADVNVLKSWTWNPRTMLLLTRWEGAVVPLSRTIPKFEYEPESPFTKFPSIVADWVASWDTQIPLQTVPAIAITVTRFPRMVDPASSRIVYRAVPAAETVRVSVLFSTEFPVPPRIRIPWVKFPVKPDWLRMFPEIVTLFASTWIPCSTALMVTPCRVV